MADPVPISLARGSSAGRYGQLGVTKLTNAYVEDLTEGGKTTFAANAINGLQVYATLTGGSGMQRLFYLDKLVSEVIAPPEMLAVSNAQLYSIIDGVIPTTTLVGGFGFQTTDFVTIAANRNVPRQASIVGGGLWYIYAGGVLTQGTDANLPPPLAVVEIDGYFIYPIADGRFFAVGPNFATPVNPLTFALADTKADGNVMAGVRGRELVLFGKVKTEFWSDVGGAVFPFSRTQAINVGCYAPGSVANVLNLRPGAAAGDTLIWAATDQQGGYSAVVILDGYSAVPISTQEIDRLILAEPNPAGIRAFAWTEDGHAFYCISGTAFSKVFDTRTQEWHDRASLGSSRWIPSCHAQASKTKHIFGDATQNLLYQSIPELYTENGNRIHYEMILPNIHLYPKRFKVVAIYVDCLTGVGLPTTDDDAAPLLMMSASKDAGISWSAERQVPIGAQGQRQTRVRERIWGNFDHNGLTLKLACSAKVAKSIQQIAIEAVPLAP